MATSTGISLPSAAQRHGLHQPSPADSRAETLQGADVRGAVAFRHEHARQHPSEHILAAVAEHPLGRRVEFDDAAVAVHADDAIEGSLDGGAQAGLAALQFALAAAPLADVTHGRKRMRPAALRERHDPQVGVEGGAVGPQHGGFDVGGLARHRAPHHLHALPDVVLGHIARESPADDVLAAITVERKSGRVHVRDTQVFIPQEQAIQRTLEDGAVLLFSLAQLFQRLLLRRDLPGESQDVRAAVDHGRLEPDLVPMQAAVLVAALPFEWRAMALLGHLHEAQRLFACIGEHARTGVGSAGAGAVPHGCSRRFRRPWH